MIVSSLSHPYVKSSLGKGSLVVLRTDTIYGITANASDPRAVERLYAARQRNPKKGCIMLVSSVDDIPGLAEYHKKKYLELSQVRPTTIVVPVPHDYYAHLVRQHGTLAFRLVPPSDLAMLIDEVGPLLAPSANIEGKPPATSIDKAVAYFGDSVAAYVDTGPVTDALPSKIIAINDDDEIEIIRD